MTLLEMAAAIAHCDAAMLAERVDPTLRQQVLNRFGRSVARMAMVSQELPASFPRSPEDYHLRPGEKPF